MSGYKKRARKLTLRLNVDRYSELVNAKGWMTQEDQAHGLGLSQSTVSRVLYGTQVPGDRFIASLMHAFPDEGFDALFEIVRAPTAARVTFRRAEAEDGEAA